MEMTVRTDRMELFKGSHRFANQSHNHEQFYQFTIPTQGICHFTMENKPYRLHEGEGLIQHPGTEHYLHLDDASSVIIIKFSKDAFPQEDQLHAPPEFAEQMRLNPSDLSRKFKDWTTELMFGGSRELLASQETEIQVLEYLKGALSGSMMLEEGHYRYVRTQVRDIHLEQVLAYMREYYSEAVSIDDLAAIAGQSRYHFMRSFRAYTGITPYQHLLRLRIDDARLRLRNTSSSIAEISCSLGFSSPSQFHRIFLKLVGITPGGYRSSR
ncbi:AraC family transcriptional regulator [Paenibacillus chibensis]|uniref:AraC family transcriptional regulator n=1 Tax=Paenibacillus chibensis TaxID=59846 RepID=UPI000FDB5390|nr:AraC family transcriptional regulator [Paenibacillus chibensis]MEC0372933.1 helix-turn-helix domain-containing protein [Paenibacillus chibensis]